MRTSHSARSSAVAILGLVFAAGCGVENSLVGGECADGLVMTDGRCVAKGPDVTLITPGDPVESGNVPKSGKTPAAKVPPVTTPERISTPITAPVIDPPVTPVIDPPIVPVPPLVCAAPLVSCRDACISVVSDPMNCGACNKLCPSNICANGECQGATPGGVVLIGHDYSKTMSVTAQSKLLVNAMTMPTTEPIRVLSYEAGADADTVSETNALAAHGMPLGRALQVTHAFDSSSLASATLSQTFDVVLIHGAGAGDPALLGASWATSLGGFAMKGGVIVALDNGTTPMPQLLTSSGLLTVASHTTLPATTRLVVTSAQDVVGAQVPSPYAAFGLPVSFQGVPVPNDDLTWVVRATTDLGVLADPVVIHRIVR